MSTQYCIVEDQDVSPTELKFDRVWGWVHKKDPWHTLNGTPVRRKGQKVPTTSLPAAIPVNLREETGS